MFVNSENAIIAWVPAECNPTQLGARFWNRYMLVDMWLVA